MSVRYLCAFLPGAGVRARCLAHLAESTLCDLISESFVPARVLGCSLEALQRAVYLCAVRSLAGCGDPVASSLAEILVGAGFSAFCPRALALRARRPRPPLDPRE